MPTPQMDVFQRPVRVKVCGITNLEDALFAADAGADALGFVFWEKSPRRVEVKKAARIIKALPPFVSTVGVFVNEEPGLINAIVKQAGLTTVQLHGDETPEFCSRIDAKVIKAFRIKDAADIARLADYKASAFLLDAFKKDVPGGTGQTFDWGIAGEAKRHGRIILSGGLNPDNVKEAVRRVRPYAIDASSGVESSPGEKDPAKVERFIAEALGA